MTERFLSPAELMTLNNRVIRVIHPDDRQRVEAEGWVFLNKTQDGDLIMYLPELKDA